MNEGTTTYDHICQDIERPAFFFQSSKRSAKSIDLCNNPLTKESKLDAARRIAPEWTDLDEEMHALGEEISSGASASKTGPVAKDSHSHNEL